MHFHVYIIQSECDGTYYIGSTTNLEDRVERHNQGRSQYTKAKRPWKLVYFEEHPDRSSAVKRENQIKTVKVRGIFQIWLNDPVTGDGEGREFPAQERDLRASFSSSPPQAVYKNV